MSTLEDILVGLNTFLQPYLSLANSHNVDYLTCDHWNTYVPEWLKSADRIDLYNLYDQHWQQTNDVEINDALQNFIEELIEWRRRIETVVYTKERFELEILSRLNDTESKQFKYKNRTFMSQKKEHEVDVLAPIINQIARLAHANAVRKGSHLSKLFFIVSLQITLDY